MKHYAKEWNCGFGATRAETGRNAVVVYSFETRSERDSACAEYRAPNHCPTAAMEAVTSSDVDVRRALRENDVLEWLAA